LDIKKKYLNKYLGTDEEISNIKNYFILSTAPFVLSEYPTKENNKLIILNEIVNCFDVNKQYDEIEVNEILINIFCEYVSIRRDLVSYGFMERNEEGTIYWTTK